MKLILSSKEPTRMLELRKPDWLCLGSVQISIDSSSTNVAIRSDGTFGPITLTGSISEVGGTGEIFENLAINV